MNWPSPHKAERATNLNPSATAAAFAESGHRSPAAFRLNLQTRYPLRHEHTTTISVRTANDPRQHACQRRAVARGVMWAVVIQIKAPACACGTIPLCGKISPARRLIETWNWPSSTTMVRTRSCSHAAGCLEDGRRRKPRNGSKCDPLTGGRGSADLRSISPSRGDRQPSRRSFSWDALLGHSSAHQFPSALEQAPWRRKFVASPLDCSHSAHRLSDHIQ